VHGQINCTLDSSLDPSDFESFFTCAIKHREAAPHFRVGYFLTNIWDALSEEVYGGTFPTMYGSTDAAGLTTVSGEQPDVCLYNKANTVLLLAGDLKVRVGELPAAINELGTKMRDWNPHFLAGLPFLPCFVWAGNQFQWAMLRGKATCAAAAEIVISPNPIHLASLSGRLRLLRESMNMLTVLSFLNKAASPHMRLPLFKWVNRSNGNSFRMQGSHVVKVCEPAPKKVYGLLKSGVSGAVRIEKISALKGGRVKLHVSPVCLSVQPKTEAELKSATKAVLTALTALHTEGLVHRDIRWDNVLRSRSGHWLLADFKEAETAGRVLDVSLRNEPEMFLPRDVLEGKPYTAKADVWAVGNLVQTWAASYGEAKLSRAGKGFMDALLKETPEERPTALEALNSDWLKA
jgi:hypothetical protein